MELILQMTDQGQGSIQEHFPTTTQSHLQRGRIQLGLQAGASGTVVRAGG